MLSGWNIHCSITYVYFLCNYITELNDQCNQPDNIQVKPEEEVDADEKGPYIFQNEVEKFIKDMKDKKPTGEEDAPGDVLKVLVEEGLRLMTQLINNIHETWEWPMDFNEVTIIPLKKKPTATKCSDHCTASLHIQQR